MEYRLYGWVIDTAWSIEPGGSNDTRACRLHNHSIFPAGDVFFKRTGEGEEHETGAYNTWSKKI